MNNIPTAEDVLIAYNIGKDHPDFDDIVGAMKEFANIHRERILMTAAENADLTLDSYMSIQEGGTMEIDKESILDSYPKSNIK